MVWAIQLQEFIAGGLLPALSVIMLKVKCYGELPQWEKGRMVKIEELEDENHIGYWEEVVKSAPKNINMLLAVNGRRFEKGSYIVSFVFLCLNFLLYNPFLLMIYLNFICSCYHVHTIYKLFCLYQLVQLVS